MAEIYYNGIVYTGTLPLQEAFIVENGVFRACGTNQEICAQAGETDTCIDLEQRFVCAGFNDSHMHLLNFGQSLRMAHLADHTDSLEGMLEYMRTYILEHPVQEGQWIKGRGWNQDYFRNTDRMPNRYDLDSISTDIPIILTRACGHVCVVNSRVLELAGITADTVSPDGGAVGMENGEPDGRFFDNAMSLFRAAVPLPDKEEIKEMIRLACRTLNTYGITSSQTDDYGVFQCVPYTVINEAYRELKEEGTLTVRVNEQSNFTTLEDLRSFIEAGNVTGTGDEYFRIGPLKMLGDGSLGGRSAHLSIPYADDPSTCGFSLFTPEQMNSMISYANSHNMQVAVHAIGDACLDMVLNAIDLALQECPREDHRHGIIHCQITRRDQLERMIALNLHIYAQSIFLDYDNHIVESRAGRDLASTSYSWKTLMNGGLSVSNGSDCPVELPDVLEGMECAVTRTSLDGTGPYLPREALSVQEAIDSFTIRAAEASFEENYKGRIAPGYMADFVILGDNPFTCDARSIHSIPVCASYLAGKQVYQR